MPEALAPPGQRGHLEIRPQAVERVGRRAAVEVDGVVRGVAGRLARHELPAVASRRDGDRVRLDVAVAVTWGLPLGEVATAVQRSVAARVEELTALHVETVDVSVDSVVLPPDPGARRAR